MKIVLIDGSPKKKDSASVRLLGILKRYFPDQAEVLEIGLHNAEAVAGDVIDILSQADACVISCPLYVDGIPGHLLQGLQNLEAAGINRPQMHIYGIVNCGFYEGIQAEFALQILQNWSHKAGFIWSGGIGVGGGGAIAMLPETAQPIIAPVCQGLEAMTAAISNGKTMGNEYVTLAFPRFLYRFSAQSGWRQMIRENGGKPKDLGRIPD